MKNKIIFRAKLKDTGKWVYWDELGTLTTVNGKVHELLIEKGKAMWHYHQVIQIRHLLDMGTLGQYIGLMDTKKKKIFTGDWFLYEDDSGYPSYETFTNVGQIAYAGNQFYVTERNRVNMEDLVEESTNTMYGKVVGNIYDTPDYANRWGETEV